MVTQSKQQQRTKRQPQRERPARQDLSTDETLRRLRTIDQWRKKQLAAFKKRYPDYFKDQA
jgi:lipase chaperone LimK